MVTDGYGGWSSALQPGVVAADAETAMLIAGNKDDWTQIPLLVMKIWRATKLS